MTDVITYGVMGILGILALGLVYLALDWALSRHTYSRVEVKSGMVTNMDYDPPRTTYHPGTKDRAGYTTTTPAQHHVYIKVESKELHHDNERLYQSVRLDDEVEVKYQKAFKYYVWQEAREAKDAGWRILSVTTPKKRVVQMNSEKEVTRKGGYDGF